MIGKTERISQEKVVRPLVSKHWAEAPGLELWLAALDGVSPGEWDPLYAQMDPLRQARCDRYVRQRDARRCILADALARRAVSALSGLEPGAVSFARHPGGKPYVPGVEVHFNLSHSGDLVLCAAAPFPVGADLQQERPLSPALVRRMARAGFPGGSEADFFRWWVHQEAVGKLTGQGLSLAPLSSEPLALSGELEAGGLRYYYCVCSLSP